MTENINMRISLFFLLVLLSFTSLNAQQQICGDQISKLLLEKKYPGVNAIIEHTFAKAQKEENLQRSSVVLKIPVVFHVVYNNDAQNISDQLIQEQIDILNEDFRRANANASETRDLFLPVAADAEIEFFLAGEDPEGSPSSGITRTETDITSFTNIDLAALFEAITECGFDLQDPEILACIFEFIGLDEGLDLDAMKFDESGGKDAWDTDRYMNVWVANLSIDAGGMESPFILGFAYPPMEAPNWPDGTLPENLEDVEGVVLHYQVVGRTNPNLGALAGINDQGRTAVHEVGHYLGLRHIWGDGDCTEDDGIDDTPAAGSNSQPTYDVPSCSDTHGKDSCENDMLPDMIENYMDYSVESCQNMFTIQQVDLMRNMLLGPRSGLLENTISSTNDITNIKLAVLPNPSTGLVQVSGTDHNIDIKVFSQAGQLIHNQTKTNRSINLSFLENGIYFLELSFEGFTEIHKLAIVK